MQYPKRVFIIPRWWTRLEIPGYAMLWQEDIILCTLSYNAARGRGAWYPLPFSLIPLLPLCLWCGIGTNIRLSGRTMIFIAETYINLHSRACPGQRSLWIITWFWRKGLTVGQASSSPPFDFSSTIDLRWINPLNFELGTWISAVMVIRVLQHTCG
jgi:hypothetical protein